MKSLDLSIVIPCKNEEGNLETLIKGIWTETTALKLNTEIIFIDDNSTDNTWGVIKGFANADNSSRFKVRGIKLGSPSGQQRAIISGYRYASGKFILTMDGDGQHPTKYIPYFWAQRSIEHAVVGIQNRERNSKSKSFMFRLFYSLYARLSELSIIENGGDFRLISIQLAKYLVARSSSFSVIRFLIAEEKIKTRTLDFKTESRISGTPSYTLRQRLSLVVHSIFHSSKLTSIANRAMLTLASGASLLIAAYAVSAYFRGLTVPGWTSTLLVFSTFATANFIILGILIKLIYNIWREIQFTDKSFVSETVGFKIKKNLGSHEKIDEV
jgi:dolichol-phosphate mannosyltransferase